MKPLDLDSLYRDHARFLGRSILRLVGDASKVEDILHESFVVAMRKKNQFDPDKGEPAAWLYGIAAKVCKSHKRSERRFFAFKEKASQEERLLECIRPDESLERQEEAKQVFAAMQKIPFKQREVFSLYELEGLDGERIASLLNIPKNTVWTRLHHAREKFSEAVGRKLPKEEVR